MKFLIGCGTFVRHFKILSITKTPATIAKINSDSALATKP